MRLNELVLERYGAYEERRLTLDGPGLTVVYGPNEAGKSTCLAAIGDFLFRIPERTPRTSIYGSELMRIGATLTAAGGQRLILKRRLGRGRTLINEAGEPCDDVVLGALLGTTTRDRFEHLFGLNHESLRAGGDQLLRADGEIGRLIVEAGGGLRTLMGRLDAIDQEIDGLFATRRSGSRAFYRALDAFETADKASKAATMTRESYDRDRSAQEAAASALDSTRASRRDLDRRLSQLQRIERVIPTLRELEDVERGLVAYETVESLGIDFADRCDQAFTARDSASDELARSRLNHDELSTRLGGMVVNASLVEAEVVIRDIEQRVTLISAARNSRLNRLIELNEAEAQLTDLHDQLSLSPEVDLTPLLPAPGALDTVQELAKAAIERRTRLESAGLAVEAAEDAVKSTELRMDTFAKAGRHEAFGVSASAFAALPSEWAAAQGKLKQASLALEREQTRASVLGFADLAVLRDLACPQAAFLRAEIAVRNEAAAERTRLIVERGKAEGALEVAKAEIERLRQGAEIATDEALASAREKRSEAWRPIRAAHLAGQSTLPDVERKAEVATLETEMSASDHLADSRTTEANRIASLIEATRRQTEAGAVIAAAQATVRRLEDELKDREATFLRAFPELSALRSDIVALVALLDERDDILAKAAAAEVAKADADLGLQQLAPRIEQLELAESKARLVPAPSDSLSKRVQAVVQAITQHEQAHAEYQRDARDLIGQQEKLVAARRSLAALDRVQQAWTGQWPDAVAVLGLAPDATPEAGDNLARLWTGARGELRSLEQTRRRLTRMDEDEAELAEVVTTTAQVLKIEVPEDRVAAGAMLVERWRTNDKIKAAKETLAPDLKAAETVLASQERASDEAGERLRVLAREAGLDEADEIGLKSIAERRRGLTALTSRREALVHTLRSAGDNLDPAQLREEAGEANLDMVRADISDLNSQLGGMDGKMEDAVRAEQRARDALRTHEDSTAAGHAAVERESATTEMHAVVERYVELKLARELVAQAIGRVRAEQQDPLIRQASTMFARMTRGDFDGVATDVDAKGAPVVVGLRPGGRTEGVATMSDGTRDQLFLAFRLASLANYCTAAEPLPFIADDILVHFDDTRGAATLDLLAEFSSVTQVLLFTHHLSVRDAAANLAKDGRANIVQLGS